MPSFFFFLISQPSFPRMVMLTDQAPVHLSQEEVAVHAGREVLMDVDDIRVLIVDNP